tara:strand:- start:1482 stop:2063 length:582 start_codon:yes stop_codon:yes gene_type:complete
MTLQQTIQSIEHKLYNSDNTISIVDHLWNIDTFLENHHISDTLTETDRWHQEVQLWQKHISSKSSASRNCFSMVQSHSHSIKAKAIKRNFEVELAGRVILSEKKILELKEHHKTTLSVTNKNTDKLEHSLNHLEQLYDLFKDDLNNIKTDYNTQLYLLQNNNTKLSNKLYRLENTLSYIFICLFIIIMSHIFT